MQIWVVVGYWAFYKEGIGFYQEDYERKIQISRLEVVHKPFVGCKGCATKLWDSHDLWESLLTWSKREMRPNSFP